MSSLDLCLSLSGSKFKSALNTIQESVEGARKFASGLGRHGKFNVSPVTEKEDWQKELDSMVAEENKKKEWPEF